MMVFTIILAPLNGAALLSTGRSSSPRGGAPPRGAQLLPVEDLASSSEAPGYSFWAGLLDCVYGERLAPKATEKILLF